MVKLQIPQRKQLSTESADETKKGQFLRTRILFVSAPRVKMCRYFNGIQATYIVRYFAYLADLELKRVLGPRRKEVIEIQRILHNEGLQDLYS
jgi:hypothetical protein